MYVCGVYGKLNSLIAAPHNAVRHMRKHNKLHLVIFTMHRGSYMVHFAVANCLIFGSLTMG